MKRAILLSVMAILVLGSCKKDDSIKPITDTLNLKAPISPDKLGSDNNLPPMHWPGK